MDQSAACRCRCCCCWLHVYIQYPIEPSTNLAAKSERAKAKPRQDSSTNDEAAFLSPHLPLPAMPCHATPSQLDHDQRPAVRPLMAWKDRRTCSLWSSVLERNSSIVHLSLSHTHRHSWGSRRTWPPWMDIWDGSEESKERGGNERRLGMFSACWRFGATARAGPTRSWAGSGRGEAGLFMEPQPPM